MADAVSGISYVTGNLWVLSGLLWAAIAVHRRSARTPREEWDGPRVFPSGRYYKSRTASPPHSDIEVLCRNTSNESSF